MTRDGLLNRRNLPPGRDASPRDRRPEKTLEGHGSEQSGSTWGDEAGRCHLSPVDGNAHLGDGPDLLPTSSDLDRLGTQREDLELISQRTRNHQERRTSVDQQVKSRRPPCGTGETG